MGDEVAGPVKRGARLAWAGLGFGLAALVAAWHAVSAPLGLAVGLASALLAVRALRAGGSRRPAAASLAVALAAVLLSGLVLAGGADGGRAGGARAGGGGDVGEAATATGAAAGPVGEGLGAAAARSRAARERARGELEALERAAPPAPSR